MTDATERRLAGLLAQISEMIDSRLPPEGIKANSGLAMWQFWLAIATIVFFAGTTVIQIENNSDATKVNAEHITGNSESLTAHMQWELEHALAIKDAEIEKLRNAR